MNYNSTHGKPHLFLALASEVTTAAYALAEYRPSLKRRDKKVALNLIHKLGRSVVYDRTHVVELEGIEAELTYSALRNFVSRGSGSGRGNCEWVLSESPEMLPQAERMFLVSQAIQPRPDLKIVSSLSDHREDG